MKFKFNYKALLVMVGTIIYFYFLIIGIETKLNDDYDETINWRDTRKETFFLNVLILYSLFILLLGIFNRYLISFVLTNVVVIALASISYYKFSFLSEFLYPWDLLLFNNVLNLLPNIYSAMNIQKVGLALGAVIVLLAVIIIYSRFKKPGPIIKLYPWVRLLFITMGVVYLSAFIFYRSFPKVKTSLELAGITNLTFDQNRNYKTNGFLITFLLNMQSAIVIPPKGYSEKNVMDIVEQLEKDRSESETTLPAGGKPNIVIIMNESFWDPTLMEKVVFNMDPMPTVREHQVGQILTPTFGGGTSNVEFEALTGFTNTFLPTGSVPYQQYIKSPLQAMPRYLSDLGYKSLAVHPYPKWFWNREEVYEHLGFEEFIDIDGFKNPIYKGPFVSDHQITKTIIEEIDETEDPVFIYAITMQNHTGYGEDKYDDYTVEVKSPPEVDELFNLFLRSYTQGIADADAAFKELIDYYGKSDEPTLVVFFGDHLPAIGHDYRLYKQAGYVPRGVGKENWDLKDIEKASTTPLAMWNNFEVEIPNMGTISPSFIGPVLFEVAGIEKPLYYTLLEHFAEVLPGYTRELKIGRNNDLFIDVPAEAEDVNRDYHLIQHDLLFGEKFGEKKLFEND